MPTITERLRAALLPELEVERELASGGMGTVFLARDPLLERRVAVKTLHQELATAVAVEQFVTEAKTHADFFHPNVVPIYKADIAKGLGLPYYVMAFVEGPTLASRLEDGPLSPRDAAQLGMDLLDALGAIHARGIVHRDIKPANVYLQGRRALLGDFGIAIPTTAGPTGRVQGTPGYMPPEQQAGDPVTPRTDLYALGALLYEAYTGKLWYGERVKANPWRGVPRAVVPVLRRALAPSPGDRWPNAEMFRTNLRLRSDPHRGRRLAVRVAMPFVAAVAAATVYVVWPEPASADVAILPFAVRPGTDAQWSNGLVQLAAANLDADLLEVTSSWSALRTPPRTAADTSALFARLRVPTIVFGTASVADDSLDVRLMARDRDGDPRQSAVIRMSRVEAGQIGCRLGLEIVRLVAPNRQEDYACNIALQGAPTAAVWQWLDGMSDFYDGAWANAERHFEQALELDPGFARARWGLLDARRWLRTMRREDVERLAGERDELGQRERLVLGADLADGPERFAAYEQLLDPRQYGHDAYIWLLYGTELFHRGALYGVPLDSALSLLQRSAALDSTFAPTYLQLAWALIRLGHREAAQRAVARLSELSAPDAEIPPAFLQLAYFERFARDTARAMLQQVQGAGAWSANPLAQGLTWKGVRWGLSFGAAEGQEETATTLLSIPGAPDSARAQALEARALARLALGRVGEGLADIDSAAALFGTQDAALQVAQWRVMLPALDLPGVPAADVATARERLVELVDTPALSARAAWTLAVDAHLRGDTRTEAAWRARAAERGDPSAEAPLRFLDVLQLHESGDAETALAAADALVARSYLRDVTPETDERRQFPFFRSLLYSRRGAWRKALERPGADREWIWWQNSDIEEWPSGPAQAGEIDWVMEALATRWRAETAFGERDTRTGCALAALVRDRWRDADTAFAPLLETLAPRGGAPCPP